LQQTRGRSPLKADCELASMSLLGISVGHSAALRDQVFQHGKQWNRSVLSWVCLARRAFEAWTANWLQRESSWKARLKLGRSQLNTEIDQGTRGLEEEHSPFGYGRS